VALLKAGYCVVLVDNLSNSYDTAVDAIKKAVISDVQDADQRAENLTFVNVDLADAHNAHRMLRAIFECYEVDAVIHLAAYKSVPESVAEPLLYYQNNLCSLLNVLQVMDEFQVHRLIFSSSATVYSPEPANVQQPDDQGMGLTEDAQTGPTNPYGRTKLFGEAICKDMANVWRNFKQSPQNEVHVVSLRYGNPVNSHPSGALPETPVGGAMNLFNVAMEVLSGKRAELKVFGRDYPTPDGTGVRDYIHVVDLADAHVTTINKMFSDALGHYDVFNIGIGRGFSVLQIVATLEKIHQQSIPHCVESRRPGDVASVVFNVTRAEHVLSWKAKHQTVEELCCLCVFAPPKVRTQ
jgi:UDP-glucose 4-epimerase